MTAVTNPQLLDVAFGGVIMGGEVPTEWSVITVPNSGEILGTRRPVKVEGTIDGQPFAATLLPNGDGTHMLPLKAALRKVIGKGAGDEIAVHLERRLS